MFGEDGEKGENEITPLSAGHNELISLTNLKEKHQSKCMKKLLYAWAF